MSIAGGFLFGWAVSAPVTVFAAVAGAAAVFQIVKTSLGAALAERAGPFLQRLSRGFAENAFSLLLFLRLTPVFPFFMVNAVAGPLPRAAADIHHRHRHRHHSGLSRLCISGVRAGQRHRCADCGPCGLHCREGCGELQLQPRCRIAHHAVSCLLAFAGLGLVALIPVALKYFKRKPA
jgi:hypothetical protein